MVPAPGYAEAADGQKLRQFAAEARSLNAADLSRMTETKGLTLIAALLRRRAAAALDEAAEMFVRLTARMHNRAREALDEHLKRHTDETDALVALLRETAIAAKSSGDPAVRLATIDALLLPDADGIIERCEALPHWPAAITCRCSAASTRVNAPLSSAFSNMRNPFRPRRTAPSRRRSAICSTIEHTGTQGLPWCAMKGEATIAPSSASSTCRSCRTRVAARRRAEGPRARAPRGRPPLFRVVPVHASGQRAQVGRPLPARLRRLWRLPRSTRVVGGLPPRRRRRRARDPRGTGRSGARRDAALERGQAGGDGKATSENGIDSARGARAGASRERASPHAIGIPRRALLSSVRL